MAAEKSDDAVTAIVCPAIGTTFDQAIGSLQLARWPRRPTGGVKPHEVRVRVYACALNFFDLLGAVGKYQYKYEPPYVLGSECSGRVVVKVGDDVCVGMSAGLFASEVVVPGAACLPKPASWTHVQSAAVSVGFLTAYHGLVQRGGLKKGDTLLVTGATGGMGAVACQIGKVVGATVIAGCSSPEKCAFAKNVLGVDHAIDYSKGDGNTKKDDLKTAVHKLTGGKGVDVVYDVVGGDVFDSCVRAMAWMGRLLVVGFAAGRIPALPANLALVKSFSLIGVASGAALARDPALALDAARKLDAWSRDGLLPPPPVHAVFPATQYAAACTAIADRSARGKVVIQFLTEPDAKPTYTPADVKPTPQPSKPKAKL